MSFLKNAGLSALDTAVGFISAGWQNRQQRKNMRYQHELNEKSAENAYARQLDFWNKNNEYNSYSNQRRLMESAGLNPALMYENGSAGALAGGADVPQGSGASGGSAASPRIGSMLEASLMAAQINNINADTKQKLGDTKDPGVTQAIQQSTLDALHEDIRGRRIANDIKDIELSYAGIMADTNARSAEQKLKNLKAEYQQTWDEITALRDTHKLFGERKRALDDAHAQSLAGLIVASAQVDALKSGSRLDQATAQNILNNMRTPAQAQQFIEAELTNWIEKNRGTAAESDIKTAEAAVAEVRKGWLLNGTALTTALPILVAAFTGRSISLR